MKPSRNAAILFEALHSFVKHVQKLVFLFCGKLAILTLILRTALLSQMHTNLAERDWRWNCDRSFHMRLAGGDVDFFFIDTSPFVQKYYSTPWANFTGAHCTGSSKRHFLGAIRLYENKCKSAIANCPVTVFATRGCSSMLTNYAAHCQFLS